MQGGFRLCITPTAAAELGRQAAFTGTAGLMHLDLVEDICDEGWLHVRLRPGHCSGIPVARADGITLYAPENQLSLIAGLILNYHGDLSGGGFLISSPYGAESCACGGGFRLATKDE